MTKLQTACWFVAIAGIGLVLYYLAGIKEELHVLNQHVATGQHLTTHTP